MAKTLTSFRILPSGRSVIPTPKAEESSQGFIREKAFSSEVARLFLPLFGYAERREPYGLRLTT